MIYRARINYDHPTLAGWPNWSNMLSRVVEVFGLPGDRYTTSPNVDFMDFNFTHEQDRLLFLTGWPAYIPMDINENCVN
jgi:hypothetical protein